MIGDQTALRSSIEMSMLNETFINFLCFGREFAIAFLSLVQRKAADL